MANAINYIAPLTSDYRNNGSDFYDSLRIYLNNSADAGGDFHVETVHTYQYNVTPGQISHDEGNWQSIDGYGTGGHSGFPGETLPVHSYWIDEWDGLKPIKIEAKGIGFVDTEYFYNGSSTDTPYIYTPPNYSGPDGPRAKDFDSGLIQPENTVQSGLNFGTIYSELVHAKDYDPIGDYAGYTFVSSDFAPTSVVIGTSDPISPSEAGISVDGSGNITIDTNATAYQYLEGGEQEEVIVNFDVTDNYNNSDQGTITFNVSGTDEAPKSLESDLKLAQRHTPNTEPTHDYLELGYVLKGDDNTGNAGGSSEIAGVDKLTNVAVLGPNSREQTSYTLEISAKSIKSDWKLEAADIVLEYNHELFDKITASDIQLNSNFSIQDAIAVDDDKGLIRFAAASAEDLGIGSSLTSEEVFATIELNFNESYFRDTATSNEYGQFTIDGNPLGFKLFANSDETIFSRDFKSNADGSANDQGTFDNREIKSLGDLDGDTVLKEGKVNLYQAEIDFEEKGNGLTFGTQRVIGSAREFTNLIRSGDNVIAKTEIENIGNSLARNIIIEDSKQVDNVKFISSNFIDESGISLGNSVNLKGGQFTPQREYNGSSRESVELEIQMQVTGQAGKVINTAGLFNVKAEGMDQNPDPDTQVFTSDKGSKNLITYQGDLNYDGRVSMKDLAFLNAGAARQVELSDGTIDAASVARDVDANFDNVINLADLAVLDKDWGKSLHTPDAVDSDFVGHDTGNGHNSLTWDELDDQGSEEWDNTSFIEQNAIELDPDYVGSLEVSTSPDTPFDDSVGSQE